MSLLLNKVAKINKAGSFAVLSSQDLGNGSIRATLRMSGKWSQDQLDKTVTAQTEGKLCYVENSAVVVNHPTWYLVNCVLKLNKSVMEYNEENLKDKKVVTANVMSDDENNIWRVVSSGDSRMLVQQTNDDATALLERFNETAAYLKPEYDIKAIPAQERDYVMAYVDDMVRFGFVYNDGNKIGMVDRVSNRCYEISPKQVLACVQHIENNPLETLAGVTNAMGDQMIAFFRQVYASQPAFLAKLEAEIRKSVSMS